MAVYTHFISAADPSQEALLSGYVWLSSFSANQIILVRQDGVHIELDGTNFSRTFDATLGYLYSGTVTSAAISDAGGNPLGTITGESVNLGAIIVPNGTAQPYMFSSTLFDHNDTLNGNNGDEHLSGGAGDDIINGFLGANRIDGGAGFDIVNVNVSWTTASFQHNSDGSWTIGFNGGFDLVQNVESVHFSDATIALREPTHSDFGALGRSELAIFNPTSAAGGISDLYNPAQAQFLAGGTQLIGTGDFNGDGTSDLVLRNDSNGNVFAVTENMNQLSGAPLVGGSSTSYTGVGVGDFNGDGISDVLFRNNTTGDFGFNQTNVSGGTIIGSTYVGIGGSSNSYQVKGVSDFNGDTVSDILFRNDTTGDMGFVFMKAGGSSAGYQAIGGSSPAFSVVGTGDFNGDGTTDILFRNNSTGDFGFDQINNGVNTGYHALGTSSNSYKVAAVGDYNGDGTADILFRNTATGENGYYELHNGVLGAWHQTPTIDPGYTIVV